MKKLKKEEWKKIREGMKKGVKSGYLREMAASVRPKSYSGLAANSVWHGAKYLLVMLLIVYVLMSIISLPSLFGMPGSISAQLEKFNKLNLTADVDMSSPVMFTETDPQIIIDTTGQVQNMTTEKILITEDFLAYRPYNRVVKVNITDLQEISSYRERLSSLLTFLAVLILPSILITSYIISLIKYAFLIILMCLVVFIFSRVAKKDIGLRKSLMTSIYASTVMVVIEVLFMPFSSRLLVPFMQMLGVNFYLLPILLFTTLALFASYFAGRSPKKGGEKYVEVEEIEWDF
jgi:hypothetical protein